MEICLANLARTQPMESMANPQCMKNTRYPAMMQICTLSLCTVWRYRSSGRGQRQRQVHAENCL